MAKRFVYADADDEGFRFILQPPEEESNKRMGGFALQKDSDEEESAVERRGHLVTIVGRGGTGKSILALQLVTKLLKRKKSDHGKQGPGPAVFYFTLEATPGELITQARQFKWGKKRYGAGKAKRSGQGPVDPSSNCGSTELISKGLHILSVPSPVQDLNTLILLIRQSIARKLAEISEIAAIVIDPMGGITVRGSLREELSQLKELTESHRTFLFLLAEDHIFEQHRSIEYFSHSVLHLQYIPEKQPHRLLYIQKSRSQPFRPGLHQLDLVPDHGVRISPSIQAQSADAHKLPSPSGRKSHSLLKMKTWPTGERMRFPSEKIECGSVIFLMGPPGTFKQIVATSFVAETKEPSIYISFKADMASVTSAARGCRIVRKVREVKLDERELKNPEKLKMTYFMDCRDPLLTPEYVLFAIRVILSKIEGCSRAVVWGLRRLRDMPNFTGGKDVQFLEALVTSLKKNGTTAMLVDWPDIERESTLPILDLCQYTLLTRVCRGREDLRAMIGREELPDSPNDSSSNVRGGELSEKLVDSLWPKGRDHVTLLRVQRTPEGFHRGLGVLLLRRRGEQQGIWMKMPTKSGNLDDLNVDFEYLWGKVGVPWEKDYSLMH